MVTLQLRQIKVSPGQSVSLEGVDWSEFEAILAELGDNRSTRIAYNNGTLTIVAPLYVHESFKASLGDVVKVLLEELDIDYSASGSTTFRRKDLSKGVEPDDSFYIQNFSRVLNKDRINLSVDPPPDLAIEVDMTSKTDLEVYEALGVSELWRYEKGRLRIDVLRDGKYVQSEESFTFLGWPIVSLTEDYVVRSRSVGQGRATREFRQKVRKRIANL